MYLLLGNSRMESGDCKGAIKLFERARAQMRPLPSRGLSVVSLVSFLMVMLQRVETANPWQISGWKFDDLDITVRQRICEALHATGRIKEAGESLLNIINAVDEDVSIGPIVTWVSGKLCYHIPLLCIRLFATVFLERYLSTPEISVDTTLHSPSLPLLLREWAKLKLTGGSWRDALDAAINVSISFCSGASRWFDTPLVWSLQPRDS